MVEKIHVDGYDKLKKILSGIEPNRQTNIYFTGKPNELGVSWCPDCVKAAPVIEKAVEECAQNGTLFIHVDVGNRSDWKNMKNPFRTDNDIHISVIPALIRFKKHQRLEGQLCENFDLLKMFFTDED